MEDHTGTWTPLWMSLVSGSPVKLDLKNLLPSPLCRLVPQLVTSPFCELDVALDVGRVCCERGSKESVGSGRRALPPEMIYEVEQSRYLY